MKKIKIAVCTKNRHYGKALAKGLAEESAGIEIICADSSDADDCDVMLSDFKTPSELQISVLGDKIKESESTISKSLPVGIILKKIIKTYLEATDHMFLPQMIEDTKIVGAGSNVGGAGVSTIAITAGRILSLQSEGKVIYINCSGSEDYNIYFEGNIEKPRTVKELIFRIKYSGKILLDDYIFKDEFGLCVLSAAEDLRIDDIQILLKYLCESKHISYIVIDAGKNIQMMNLCHDQLIISNYNDVRCSYDEGVINNSMIKGKDRIRYDGTSFEKIDNKVRISLEGIFAEDIKDIVQDLVQ